MPELDTHGQDAHAADPGSALAHLAKMSGTGSSFGQADYVAISPQAIASLVFGFLSLLSLVFIVFLAAAAAGVFLGTLAVAKIRRSNGTQSGLILALAGVLLSLGVGGAVVARTVSAAAKERDAIRACEQLVARFAEDVKAENYDDAYDNLTTESFRAKFDKALFRTRYHDLQTNPDYPIGPLQWYRLTDQPIHFSPIVDSDASKAESYALAKFTRQPEIREPFIMNNLEGEWKIESIPRLFQIKKPKKKEAGE